MFHSDKIYSESFILACVQSKSTTAYKALCDCTISDNIEIIENWCIERLKVFIDNEEFNDLTNVSENINNFLVKIEIDKEKDNSLKCLYHILQKDVNILTKFKSLGITIGEIKEYIREQNSTEKINNKSTTEQHNKRKKVKQTSTTRNTNLDEILINLSNLSNNGKIEEVYNNEKIYDKIFSIFSKKGKNNVIIVGDDGVGKTATVKHIANLIRDGLVPKNFMNKQLMLLDFLTLTAGTGFRGGFETKWNGIINIASKNPEFIFFIDDIQSILNNTSKFTEVSTDVMLDMILSNQNINFICTTTPENYSRLILNNQLLKTRLEKVTLSEKNIDEVTDIVNKKISIFENYHNVKYSFDAISTATKLCKRYVTDNKMPDSVIDLLDEVGANIILNKKTNPFIEEVNKKLLEITAEKEELINTSSNKDADRIDELVKEEITLEQRLKKLIKEEKINNKKTEVTVNDIKNTLAKKIDIPIDNLTDNELLKLKNIDTNIKKSVIGQDEAVDEICKAVKRQRVGLNNPNKPVNLLMVGPTGVGKTFLAKKLAEQIFGSESNMVRIDMSEYADSTSLNKLIGAGQGYLGYDDGGVLTEAIKKKPYCVLLLDEIEKANGKIYDMFLQVFDDGRLSDNKGQLINFKNVIILMTSNVGVKEANETTANIGFVRKDESLHKKDIIEKNIKKHFKPEFINRIDKIIFFNSLNDENIKNIIKLEIKKVEKLVEENNYSLDKDITDGELNDIIYEKIQDEREYGARPIVREIQRTLVDKLTDFIIDNNPPKGYVFKLKDIYN